jgi:TRAP transporter TAXI family solute receptor
MAIAFTRDLVADYERTIPSFHGDFHNSPSVLVVSALQRGEVDVGVTQADLIYRAFSAGVSGEAYPHTNMRSMAVLWMNRIYVLVRRDSPYRRLGDLRGKRVGILQKETAGEFVTPIVLSAYGMTYKDIQPTFQSASENFKAVANRTLDAMIQVNPTLSEPRPSVSLTDFTVLPFDRDAINRLRSDYPFLKRVPVPRSELPTLDADVDTVGVDAVLVCRKDLGEQLVYELTRELFAAVPRMTSAHPLAALIDEDQASLAPIPLHPGAARYYREREILR